MANKSYHNPHSVHERELADTYYRETVEILFGPEEEPNRRGGCLVVTAVAVIGLAAVIVVGWLL